MKQRRKKPHEKGLAIHSAPSFALVVARRPVKRKQGDRWAPEVSFTDANLESLVDRHAEYYSDARLNGAIGNITPKDMLADRQQEIYAERDRKLEDARKQRQIRRQQAA